MVRAWPLRKSRSIVYSKDALVGNVLAAQRQFVQAYCQRRLVDDGVM